MKTFRTGNIPMNTSTKTEDFYFLRGISSPFLEFSITILEQCWLDFLIEAEFYFPFISQPLFP
jgi:hypothetical protein